MVIVPDDLVEIVGKIPFLAGKSCILKINEPDLRKVFFQEKNVVLLGIAVSNDLVLSGELREEFQVLLREFGIIPSF